MISNKLSQLKQDLSEVKGVIYDLEPYSGYLDGKLKELKEKAEILDEHLKDHIEDVEIFIGRTSL